MVWEPDPPNTRARIRRARTRNEELQLPATGGVRRAGRSFSRRVSPFRDRKPSPGRLGDRSRCWACGRFFREKSPGCAGEDFPRYYLCVRAYAPLALVTRLRLADVPQEVVNG